MAVKRGEMGSSELLKKKIWVAVLFFILAVLLLTFGFLFQFYILGAGSISYSPPIGLGVLNDVRIFHFTFDSDATTSVKEVHSLTFGENGDFYLGKGMNDIISKVTGNELGSVLGDDFFYYNGQKISYSQNMTFYTLLGQGLNSSNKESVGLTSDSTGRVFDYALSYSGSIAQLKGSNVRILGKDYYVLSADGNKIVLFGNVSERFVLNSSRNSIAIDNGQGINVDYISSTSSSVRLKVNNIQRDVALGDSVKFDNAVRYIGFEGLANGGVSLISASDRVELSNQLKFNEDIYYNFSVSIVGEPAKIGLGYSSNNFFLAPGKNFTLPVFGTFNLGVENYNFAGGQEIKLSPEGNKIRLQMNVKDGLLDMYLAKAWNSSLAFMGAGPGSYLLNYQSNGIITLRDRVYEEGYMDSSKAIKLQTIGSGATTALLGQTFKVGFNSINSSVAVDGLELKVTRTLPNCPIGNCTFIVSVTNVNSTGGIAPLQNSILTSTIVDANLSKINLSTATTQSLIRIPISPILLEAGKSYAIVINDTSTNTNNFNFYYDDYAGNICMDEYCGGQLYLLASGKWTNLTASAYFKLFVDGAFSRRFVASVGNGTSGESYVFNVSSIGNDMSKNTTSITNIVSGASTSLDVGQSADFGKVKLTLNKADYATKYLEFQVSSNCASGENCFVSNNIYSNKGLAFSSNFPMSVDYNPINLMNYSISDSQGINRVNVNGAYDGVKNNYTNFTMGVGVLENTGNRIYRMPGIYGSMLKTSVLGELFAYTGNPAYSIAKVSEIENAIYPHMALASMSGNAGALLRNLGYSSLYLGNDRALNLDGNGYVELFPTLSFTTDLNSFDSGSNSYTISMLYKPTQVMSAPLLVRGNSSDAEGIFVNSEGSNVSFTLKVQDTSRNWRTTKTESFEIGKIYHIVGVVDRTDASNVRLYVNGVQSGTSSGGSLGNGKSYGTRTWTIGGYENGIGDKAKGVIDELIVFNRQLTPGEISGLYTQYVNAAAYSFNAPIDCSANTINNSFKQVFNLDGAQKIGVLNNVLSGSCEEYYALAISGNKIYALFGQSKNFTDSLGNLYNRINASVIVVNANTGLISSANAVGSLSSFYALNLYDDSNAGFVSRTTLSSREDAYSALISDIKMKPSDITYSSGIGIASSVSGSRIGNWKVTGSYSRFDFSNVALVQAACVPTFNYAYTICNATLNRTKYWYENSTTLCGANPYAAPYNKVNTTESCTLCSPNWTTRETSCLSNEKKVTYYVENGTSCGANPSDYSLSNSSTACDYNSNNVIGLISDLSVPANYVLDIDGSTFNDSVLYSGSKTVDLFDGNVTRVSFGFNFNETNKLNLNNLKVLMQSSTDKLGYLIVKGITISKTIRLNKINASSSQVCVRDSASVENIDSFSYRCDGSYERKLNCSVSGFDDGNYTCSIENVTGKQYFVVSGLMNSGVKEIVIGVVQPTPTPSPSPTPSPTPTPCVGAGCNVPYVPTTPVNPVTPSVTPTDDSGSSNLFVYIIMGVLIISIIVVTIIIFSLMREKQSSGPIISGGAGSGMGKPIVRGYSDFR